MWTEAYAASPNPGAPGAESPGMWNLMPMMVAMIVIIYFFMIRPQSKKQREVRNMLENIKKGDKVITVGGIIGLVTRVKGNVVTLKISSETEVDFKKSAIATVVTADVEKELNAGEEKK